MGHWKGAVKCILGHRSSSLCSISSDILRDQVKQQKGPAALAWVECTIKMSPSISCDVQLQLDRYIDGEKRSGSHWAVIAMGIIPHVWVTGDWYASWWLRRYEVGITVEVAFKTPSNLQAVQRRADSFIVSTAGHKITGFSSKYR